MSVLQAYFTVTKLFLAKIVSISPTEAQIFKLLYTCKFYSNMAAVKPEVITIPMVYWIKM